MCLRILRNHHKGLNMSPTTMVDQTHSHLIHHQYYHTIHDERSVEERLYDQVPSSPLQSANNQSQETGPTVYQDITELSM